MARFNLLFYRILPASASPALAAAELGLSPADLAYVGLETYSAKSPIGNLQWEREFYTRGGYGKVLMYYAHHPAWTLEILRRDLVLEAAERRPSNSSNFHRQDGHPPNAVTTRFGLRSRVRDWLFRQWPWHMVLWYVAILVGAAVSLFHDTSDFRRAIAWAILGVALMGLEEFFISSLLDALETGQHLLLFHLFTDLTIILALLYAVSPQASFQASIPASGS